MLSAIEFIFECKFKGKSINKSEYDFIKNNKNNIALNVITGSTMLFHHFEFEIENYSFLGTNCIIKVYKINGLNLEEIFLGRQSN